MQHSEILPYSPPLWSSTMRAHQRMSSRVNPPSHPSVMTMLHLQSAPSVDSSPPFSPQEQDQPDHVGGLCLFPQSGGRHLGATSECSFCRWEKLHQWLSSFLMAVIKNNSRHCTTLAILRPRFLRLKIINRIVAKVVVSLIFMEKFICCVT
jgi:hypothetical protein